VNIKRTDPVGAQPDDPPWWRLLFLLVQGRDGQWWRGFLLVALVGLLSVGMLAALLAFAGWTGGVLGTGSWTGGILGAGSLTTLAVARCRWRHSGRR